MLKPTAARLRAVIAAAAAATLAALGGCATYVTPGGPADFRALGISPAQQEMLTEPSVGDTLAVRPAAGFPARVAVARVQGRGYRSRTNRGWDTRSFSLVATPDVEKAEHAERLARLPMLGGVVRLNRLVLDPGARDAESLRQAAARVQADMLLLYTFDTTFGVDKTVPALGAITLGLFPNDEARVSSTASFALLDTRTGFVYAMGSARDEQRQLANNWTTRDAIDESRRRAETNAFDGLVGEFELAWKGVAESYAVPRPTNAGFRPGLR